MEYILFSLLLLLAVFGANLARLGWSKQFCKDYIKSNYRRFSRLSMTDERLINFFGYLQVISSIIKA